MTVDKFFIERNGKRYYLRFEGGKFGCKECAFVNGQSGGCPEVDNGAYICNLFDGLNYVWYEDKEVKE